LLNKQTAAELGKSEITVRVQRGQIMKKMAVQSLADLVKMATKFGIEQAPSLVQNSLPRRVSRYIYAQSAAKIPAHRPVSV
jgi:dTDP-4-dehydrorhamnose reductase